MTLWSVTTLTFLCTSRSESPETRRMILLLALVTGAMTGRRRANRQMKKDALATGSGVKRCGEGEKW